MNWQYAATFLVGSFGGSAFVAWAVVGIYGKPGEKLKLMAIPVTLSGFFLISVMFAVGLL